MILRSCLSKTTSLFVALLLFSLISTAQPANRGSCEPVRTEARFSDSMGIWENYLNNQINKEVPILSCAPPGVYTVEVLFLIEKDGRINYTKPITSLGYGMEAEVCRVIKSSPKWIAGTQNDRLVRAYRRQSFIFIVAELSNVKLKRKIKAAPKDSL